MSMIMLHTTDCPKCKILEKKLNLAGIEFDTNHNVGSLFDMGYMEAPLLQIDEDTFLTFSDAVKWVKEQT